MLEIMHQENYLDLILEINSKVNNKNESKKN